MAEYKTVATRDGGVRVPFTAQDNKDQAALDAQAAKEKLSVECEQVRSQRQNDYPAIRDQLDAIWKQMAADRESGKALVPEAEAMLGSAKTDGTILGVKAKHPLPNAKPKSSRRKR